MEPGLPTALPAERGQWGRVRFAFLVQAVEKLVEKSRPEGMENLENDMENVF